MTYESKFRRRNDENTPECNSINYKRFIDNSAMSLNSDIIELNRYGNNIYENLTGFYHFRFPELKILIPEKPLYVKTVLLLEENLEKNVQKLKGLLNSGIADIIAKHAPILLKSELNQKQKDYLNEIREFALLLPFIYETAMKILHKINNISIKMEAEANYFKQPQSEKDEEERIKEIFTNLSTFNIVHSQRPNEEIKPVDTNIRKLCRIIGYKELFLTHLPCASQRNVSEMSDKLSQLIENYNAWIDKYIKFIKGKMKNALKDLDENVNLSDKEFLGLYKKHFFNIIWDELTLLNYRIISIFGAKIYISFSIFNGKVRSTCSVIMDLSIIWHKKIFLKYENRLVDTAIQCLDELREKKDTDGNLTLFSIFYSYTTGTEFNKNHLTMPLREFRNRYIKSIETFYTKMFALEIERLVKKPKKKINERLKVILKCCDYELEIYKSLEIIDELLIQTIYRKLYDVLIKPLHNSFINLFERLLRNPQQEDNNYIHLIYILFSRDRKELLERFRHVLNDARSKIMLPKGENETNVKSYIDGRDVFAKLTKEQLEDDIAFVEILNRIFPIEE